jgi:hypothetical protein
MKKIKIWYYTTIKAEGNGIKEYTSLPKEIEYEGKQRVIRLTKDSYESMEKEPDYEG